MTHKIITILSLLIMTLSSYGQAGLEQSIWYASMIHDTLGNAYPQQNVERFMFFENENNISTITIDQKTSITNGETIISYEVEANNLAKIDAKTYKVKELRVDHFQCINKDSIYYRERGYHLGFKRLMIEKSKRTQSEFQAFLLANQVREYYENGESHNHLHVYKKDGNKEVQVIDSHSSWESPYRLISFEGFVFLRGITSYPIILHDIVNDKIIGTEINRKTDPVKTEIRIEQN